MRFELERVSTWAESGLYLTGFVLLLVFVDLRLEGEEQRVAGVQAFGQALAMQVDASESGRPEAESEIAGPPDQGLWSEQRIRGYAEARRVDARAPLAVMSIDRLAIQVPVYDGADDVNLNRGAARIAGTARIDEPGNIGIAGHRDGFFRALKDIALGDRIELLTSEGEITYTVSAIDIVDPANVSVLEPTSSRTVTLVTCYPFYFVGSAPKRFIVKAEAQVL